MKKPNAVNYHFTTEEFWKPINLTEHAKRYSAEDMETAKRKIAFGEKIVK